MATAAKPLPTSQEIAERLVRLHKAVAKRKVLGIAKSDMHLICGRKKIEDVTHRAIVSKLRKHDYALLRAYDRFVLVPIHVMDAWVAPARSAVRAAMKKPPASLPAAQTTLNPQAAWPFPTAARP